MKLNLIINTLVIITQGQAECLANECMKGTTKKSNLKRFLVVPEPQDKLKKYTIIDNTKGQFFILDVKTFEAAVNYYMFN